MSDSGGDQSVSLATAATVAPTAGSGLRIRNRWAAFRARVPFVVALVLVAFALRVAAAVALHHALIAAGGDGFIGPDDRDYDRIAWQQAQAWRGLGPAVELYDYYQLNAYTYTEAALYVVVGHQPLAMKLLNCLLGALTAGLVYLMARRLFGHLAACCSGLAAAFFPSTFLWSLTNLKEAMFLFCVALTLWLLTELVLTGRPPLLPALLVALALVGGLRIYIQGMLGLLIPGAVLLQSRARLPRKWATGALLVAGCAAVLWLSGAARWMVGFVPLVQYQRYYAALGAESAYAPTPSKAAPTPSKADGGISESPPTIPRESRGALLTWLPTGLAYALAAPFPWAAQRTIERATIPEMLLWYLALALAALGAIVHWRRWQSYAHLLAYAGGLLLLIALTQGNLGWLVRQRGMVIPFVLVFSGAGAAQLWSLQRGRGAQSLAATRRAPPARHTETK